MRLLTQDHSLVRRLQETGRLSPEDAQTYEYRNVLLQALGQDSALSADTFALELPPAGKLLLCGDGLCGVVPPEALAMPADGTNGSTRYTPSPGARAWIYQDLRSGQWYLQGWFG